MDRHWLTDLIPAFISLPRGLRPLSEIYALACANRTRRGLTLPKQPDSAIRFILQYHCASSRQYHGPNVFFGDGHGRWGLRDDFWPNPAAPDDDKTIWVDTPEPGYWRHAPGVVEQLAMPKTLEDRTVLAMLAAESSANDPRVELFVGLRLRHAGN